MSSSMVATGHPWPLILRVYLLRRGTGFQVSTAAFGSSPLEVSGNRALGQTVSGCGRNYPPDPHGHSTILGGTTLRGQCCVVMSGCCTWVQCASFPGMKAAVPPSKVTFVVRRRTAWTVPTVSLAEARPLVGSAKGSRKHALGLSHIWDRARTSGLESSPGSFQTEQTNTGASHLSSKLSECSRVRS